jgi:hypothetical protein
VSYPYLLSVETGQRDMSDPLAHKIQWLCGVEVTGATKNIPPMDWSQDEGKMVPFSSQTFEQRKTRLPSFAPDPDDLEYRVTPTLKQYGHALHAILDSARVDGRLGAALQSLFKLFAQNVSSDTNIDAFRESYRKLYPQDGTDALGALLGYIDPRRAASVPERRRRRRKKRKR